MNTLTVNEPGSPEYEDLMARYALQADEYARKRNEESKVWIKDVGNRSPKEQFLAFTFQSHIFEATDPFIFLEAIQDPTITLTAKLLALDLLIETPEFRKAIESDPELFAFMVECGRYRGNASRNVYPERDYSKEDPLDYHRWATGNELLEQLMLRDGIAHEDLVILNFDPYRQFSPDYGDVYRDNRPIRPALLLEHISRYADGRQGAHLPPELRLLLPLSREFAKATEDLVNNNESLVTFADANVSAQYMELKREYPEAAEKFQSFMIFVRGNAPAFANAYPPYLKKAVERSILDKMSGLCFALHAFEKSGKKIDTEITLSSDFTLPLHLKSDDPYELMDAIIKVMQNVESVEATGTEINRAVKADDFTIYRISNPKHKVSMYQYIRPYGGISYDEELEYGRNGEGVEASMGYVVNLDHNSFLPLGKEASKLPSTISVRIDFEGIDPGVKRAALTEDRDPTREKGTLSLDFGSVLGNQENIGVKIGRFLAYGDQLRARYSPDSSTLNHSPYFFPVGDRSEFAEALMNQTEVIKKLAARHVTVTEFVVENALT